jgi:hypothetical protein
MQVHNFITLWTLWELLNYADSTFTGFKIVDNVNNLKTEIFLNNIVTKSSTARKRIVKTRFAATNTLGGIVALP